MKALEDRAAEIVQQGRRQGTATLKLDAMLAAKKQAGSNTPAAPPPTDKPSVSQSTRENPDSKPERGIDSCHPAASVSVCVRARECVCIHWCVHVHARARARARAQTHARTHQHTHTRTGSLRAAASDVYVCMYVCI